MRLSAGSVLHSLATYKDTLRASALYGGVRLLATGINFLVFVYVARTYAPDDVGAWNYAVAVMQFAAPFLATSLEPAVVRLLVQQPTRQGEVLGSASAMVACATLVAVAIPLSLLMVLHWDDSRVRWIALGCALSFVPSFVFVVEHALRAYELARPIVTAQLAGTLAGAAVKVTAAALEAPIEVLAFAMILETALQGALLVLLGRTRLSPAPPLHVHWPTVRELARAAGPTAAAALVATLFFRLNVFLLERLGSLSEVAYYSIAYNLYILLVTVANLALAGIYPRLVALSARSADSFDLAMRWLYFGGAIAGIGAFVGAAIFLPTLLPWALGEKYEPSVGVLLWMCVALVFHLSQSIRACFINICNRPNLHLWAAVLGLLALLPAAYLLIPSRGAIGAGIAITIGSAVAAVASTWILAPLRSQRHGQLAGLFLLTPWLARKTSWTGKPG